MSDGISVSFDAKFFEQEARDIGGMVDQVPYALAQSMNDAAQATRRKLIDDVWPQAVQARNRTFLAASLTTKGQTATKRNLSVTIYDRLQRGHLAEHADGGTITPRGKSLAVPQQAVQAKRTGKGVPKALAPRAVANSFKKGDVIYQRLAGSKLRMMYVLKPKITLKQDVPFRQTFEDSMLYETYMAFDKRFEQAMNSRR